MVNLWLLFVYFRIYKLIILNQLTDKWQLDSETKNLGVIWLMYEFCDGFMNVWMQYIVMAYKSDCAVGDMEGFSSSKINHLVAICTTYNFICRIPRRASCSFLESLQVSCYLCILKFSLQFHMLPTVSF